MTTSTHATATIQLDGWTRLTFPYDPKVVEMLKLHIPASERRWVPAEKCWMVSSTYSTLGIGLIRRIYPNIVVVNERLTWSSDDDDWEDDEPSTPPPLRKTDSSFATLHLLPSAPAELVDAAYRCLARLHHPDTGGTTSAMQRINTAHGALKARRSA